MSIWLKVTLIVLAAVVVSIGISLIPAFGFALSSAPPRLPPEIRRQESITTALFVRPPQAAIDACLGSPVDRTLTHDDEVRLAKCLHRKHLVTARTVAEVERDQALGATHVMTLQSKTTRATWWWSATWGVALAAIAVVVYRDRRHRV